MVKKGGKDYTVQSNPYSGGYSDVTSQKLKAVNIPARIKCIICNKNKANASFSAKQLNDLRYKILSNGHGTVEARSGAKCTGCTGQSRVELECSRCGTVKTLDAFSNNQRKKKDDAACLICQEDVDWTPTDIRDFTTGHDEMTVKEDESADEDQPYEINERGEYATTDYYSDTSSSLGYETDSGFTSDTDGGGVRVKPAGNGSEVYRSKTSNSSASIASTETINKKSHVLTRRNLAMLPSVLGSTNRSSPSVNTFASSSNGSVAGGVNFQSAATDAATNRRNKYADSASVKSFGSAVAGVWFDQQDKKSSPSIRDGTIEEPEVWTGQVKRDSGKMYTAYDASGTAHQRRQSFSTDDSMSVYSRAPSDLNPDRSKTGNFARVRPVPRQRPNLPSVNVEDLSSNIGTMGLNGEDDSDGGDDYGP